MVTKKWVRPKNSPIAGVCAAFANALGIDVTVVRIIWLVAVLIFGTGILFYLVCWWFLPKEEKQFDPDTASFLGVCLRLSQKLEVEVAVVRIAVFLSVFLTFSLTIFAYFVAHLLLPKTQPAPTQLATK